MPSYKNKDWYQKNLTSVLSQSYSNWRAVYTDDNSPDNTGSLVEKFLKQKDIKNKFTLIKNTKRVGAMENIYNMSHSCNDSEILIHLDGDDWLPHSNVLDRLNEEYNKPNVWMTYGQYQSYPDNRIGCAKKIPDHILSSGSVRDYDWCASHMRTYYAWLFKLVKKEDFMVNGKFIEMTSDLGTMFPMLEMSRENASFIPDIMYIYNYSNPINDAKTNGQLQMSLEKIIREKSKYKKVSL